MAKERVPVKRLLVLACIVFAFAFAVIGDVRESDGGDPRGVLPAIAQAPAKARAGRTFTKDNPALLLAVKNSIRITALNVMVQMHAAACMPQICVRPECKMPPLMRLPSSCAMGISPKEGLPGPASRPSAAGRLSPTGRRCVDVSCYNELRSRPATQVTLRKPF